MPDQIDAIAKMVDGKIEGCQRTINEDINAISTKLHRLEAKKPTNGIPLTKEMVNRWDSHTLDIEEMPNQIETLQQNSKVERVDKLIELMVEQLRAYSEKFEA